MDLYGTLRGYNTAPQQPSPQQLAPQRPQANWNGYNNEDIDVINEKIRWLNEASRAAGDDGYMQKLYQEQYEMLMEPIMRQIDNTAKAENDMKIAETLIMIGEDREDEQMIAEGMAMLNSAVNTYRGLPADYGFEEKPVTTNSNETYSEKLIREAREKGLSVGTPTRKEELEQMILSGQGNIGRNAAELDYLDQYGLDKLRDNQRVVGSRDDKFNVMTRQGPSWFDIPQRFSSSVYGALDQKNTSEDYKRSYYGRNNSNLEDSLMSKLFNAFTLGQQ